MTQATISYPKTKGYAMNENFYISRQEDISSRETEKSEQTSSPSQPYSIKEFVEKAMNGEFYHDNIVGNSMVFYDNSLMGAKGKPNRERIGVFIPPEIKVQIGEKVISGKAIIFESGHHPIIGDGYSSSFVMISHITGKNFGDIQSISLTPEQKDRITDFFAPYGKAQEEQAIQAVPITERQIEMRAISRARI